MLWSIWLFWNNIEWGLYIRKPQQGLEFLERILETCVLWFCLPDLRLTTLVLIVSYVSCAEKAMAPHSSALVWKIPWTEEPGRLQSMGSRRVGDDWATSLSLFTFMHWRRKWQPTPVFLPGESQGRGSLMGCRLWGRTELDMTEATQQQKQHVSCEKNLNDSAAVCFCLYTPTYTSRSKFSKTEFL